MNKRVFKSNLALYVLFAILFAGIASAQSGPIVWVIPSLQRVRPSDPAGIEKARLIAIESPKIVGAALSKVPKDIGALQEERPFLGKECFKCAEIHDGRIDFHLAEIGIDCRIEREATADPVFDIEAGRAEQP